VWARRGLWDRERHLLPALRAPSEYVVFSVDQLDKYLVLTGRQTRHADCIVFTRSLQPQGRSWRHGEADRISGLEIDDQLILCRHLHGGEIGRLLALQDTID
jgi:hypothetical protein